jgi:hypothetical protein
LINCRVTDSTDERDSPLWIKKEEAVPFVMLEKMLLRSLFSEELSPPPVKRVLVHRKSIVLNPKSPLLRAAFHPEWTTLDETIEVTLRVALVAVSTVPVVDIVRIVGRVTAVWASVATQ